MLYALALNSRIALAFSILTLRILVGGDVFQKRFHARSPATTHACESQAHTQLVSQT